MPQYLQCMALYIGVCNAGDAANGSVLRAIVGIMRAILAGIMNWRVANMTTKQIRAVLNPLGIFKGCNLYPGEPTQLFHCVSVTKGTATQAIEAIAASGGKATHAHAYGPYSESINVYKKP